jgi:PAS domain S-box-containing protein
LKRILYILFFTAFFSTNGNSQTYTLEKLKAIHIYVFASYVEWPANDSSEVFKICLLGNDNALFNEIKEVTKSKYINNKPIELHQIRKIEELEVYDILYISPNYNSELKNLCTSSTNNNTLIITYNADIDNSMINFIFKESNLKFEINEENLNKKGFKATSRLLAMVKTKDELKDLFLKSEGFLETQKILIEEQKTKITNQENKLNQQLNEIKIQKEQLLNQKDELSKQQTRIDSQNHILNNLAKNIQLQQTFLLEKINQLSEQETILNEQKNNILIQKKEQEKITAYNQQLKLEATQQEKEIEQQQGILNEQFLLIKKQRNILLISILIVLIISALAIQVYIGLRTKKRINNQLRGKNEAIAKQKEEIEYQAQKLEITNKELEKLSIVASQTDNAVIIMNPKGDFEWINDAYTKLYGFTVDDLFSMKGKNILSADPNINLQDLVSIWFKNKKTVTLESEKEKKNGKKIWVQTTLTPILDRKGDITKLVAIDTDISQLKKTEKALLKEVDKSDKLLLNILPKKVAEELKQKGVTTPETFENVAVMFSDFVDFTKFASALEPKELMSELNELYTAFDDIIGKNNCERIKTIGDAYMAVSGMHKKVDNSALSLTKVAIEIVEYLNNRNKNNPNKWETRIGIHSGKLVGGVVGVRKYIYDIFGDTINVASRMEFHSEIMKINVSEEIYTQIKDEISCEKRTPIEVKGKGKLNMYFVKSI